MPKKRIYQVAQEFRISSEALMSVLERLGYECTSHMNVIDDEAFELACAELEKEKEALKRGSGKKGKKAAGSGRKASAEKATKGKAKTKATARGKPKATAKSIVKTKGISGAKAKTSAKSAKSKAKAGAEASAEVAERASAEAAEKAAALAAEKAAALAAEKAKAAVKAQVTAKAKAVVKARTPKPGVRTASAGAQTGAAPVRTGTESAAAKRRRKRKPRVDQKTVEETVRRTMAATEERRPRRKRRREKGEAGEVIEEQKTQLAEFSSVGEIAEAFDIPANDVIKKCLDIGLMVTINQRLDEDTVLLLADAFGEEVEFLREYGEDILREEMEEAEESAESLPRSPVVVVMGHVDHGKTLLLDFIRNSNVIASESGGITQHIGAYEIEHEGKSVTFLDTPGHEAFTAMRARGAKITDIAVLVVAADDGVMPQTMEAIDHAKAAGIPIIVAMNKMDLPTVNPDKVRTELSNQGLVAQEWGGDTIAVETSAKTGEGVSKLLDEILFQAELLELTAVREGPARGVVIEVEKERGRGVVATVLVQNGRFAVGDPFVAGLADGKVRALFDEWNRPVDAAGPSQPVQVSGLNGVPQAGDVVAVVSDDRLARDISAKRQQQQWERTTRFQHRITLEDLHKRIVEGEVRELRLVIKGDVDGSVGALADALERLSTAEVRVEVIHKGVGGVTETDVLLAAASDAVIVGFHISTAPRVRDLARREHVEIRLYKVIYEAVEDIRAAMEGLLEPERREVVVGTAEVRETFKVPGRGVIGGCYVLSGSIKRGAKARVIRSEMVHFEGTIDSLKRFKDDVREVQTGFECGIGLHGLEDIQGGDLIEVYDIEEIARKLGDPSV
ncbi:MAG: translation initiation factor IF-2 [Candidatus Eisenbacteria bacterium]